MVCPINFMSGIHTYLPIRVSDCEVIKATFKAKLNSEVQLPVCKMQLDSYPVYSMLLSRCGQVGKKINEGYFINYNYACVAFIS
jgi:hypothetical protein